MSGNPIGEVSAQPAAPVHLDYNEQLKQDFGRMFGLLELNPLQIEFLKSRWLDQVLWMEKKAARCRNRYNLLRMITIIGGVFVPILLTLTVNQQNSDDKWLGLNKQDWNKLVILGSGVVAASSAVEGFFSYGKQWYGYRQSVESLKSQGWQFFQLTGPYLGKTHADAFKPFAAQVEELIQRDVQLYVTQLSQQQLQLQEQDEQRLQKLEQKLGTDHESDQPT